MNDLEAIFKQWWEASYGRPPGTHAVMTHAAFAQHVLDQHGLPAAIKVGKDE